MVFTRIALGMATGITISMNSPEYIYLVITNCFLRPHWRYQILKKKYYSKDHALDTNLLDIYIRDIVGSFLLFWIMIGPISYKTFVKKENMDGYQYQNDFGDKN